MIRMILLYVQSYNALISTESNRELSQIQDEITKATQSSMGQVSVVGQKQNVNTEAPQLPGIPGLPGLPGIGGTGGGGGEDPLAAALGASNGAAPIEIGGGSSTGAGASLASSLQGAEGAETGAALGSEISNQQQTSMQDTGSSQGKSLRHSCAKCIKSWTSNFHSILMTITNDLAIMRRSN